MYYFHPTKKFIQFQAKKIIVSRKENIWIDRPILKFDIILYTSSSSAAKDDGQSGNFSDTLREASPISLNHSSLESEFDLLKVLG